MVNVLWNLIPIFTDTRRTNWAQRAVMDVTNVQGTETDVPDNPYLLLWSTLQEDMKCTARENVGDDLTEQAFFMGHPFVSHFLNQTKYRLRPYWKLVMVTETP